MTNELKKLNDEIRRLETLAAKGAPFFDEIAEWKLNELRQLRKELTSYHRRRAVDLWKK